MSGQIDWQRTVPIWQATPQVVAAWAFGSAQDGVLRAGGDIDIAVLTSEPLSFDQQLALIGRLEEILPFADIDLVVINEANPILRFEAVSGRPLFCRDRQRMAAFVSLTAREYEDEMAQWQRALQHSTGSEV